MTCDLQKQLAHARGWSEPWVSRLLAGHPAAGQYLRLVNDVQAGAGTDAGPLAAAPLAELMRGQAERRFKSDRDLEAALRITIRLEGKHEAAENAATLALLIAQAEDAGHPEQEIHELEDRLGIAVMRETAVQLVLLGIVWERARRRMVRGETIN